MTTDSTDFSPGLPDDAVLDRLEALLDDPALPEALRLDEAQGFLCAALAGPEPLAREDWLVEILGSEEALESAPGREAAALLEQFAAALEQAMAAGESPQLLFYPIDDEAGVPLPEGEDDNDYAAWCQAYLAGVDASESDWFESLGESEENEDPSDETLYLDERLFPMMVLTGEAEEAAREHGEAWPQGEELETLIDDCVAELPLAIGEIYRFWRARRGIAPIRRQDPKVGRNDACPCGSGKKFKQCCGKE